MLDKVHNAEVWHHFFAGWLGFEIQKQELEQFRDFITKRDWYYIYEIRKNPESGNLFVFRFPYLQYYRWVLIVTHKQKTLELYF